MNMARVFHGFRNLEPNCGICLVRGILRAGISCSKLVHFKVVIFHFIFFSTNEQGWMTLRTVDFAVHWLVEIGEKLPRKTAVTDGEVSAGLPVTDQL